MRVALENGNITIIAETDFESELLKHLHNNGNNFVAHQVGGTGKWIVYPDKQAFLKANK